MAPERYTPTQTARHAGISPNTVRLWSREYREFLSEHANPAPGVDRAYTPGDVAMMQAIAQLRANNISTADVKERLRSQPPQAPDTLQDNTTAANEAPAAPPVSNALAPASDAVQTFLAHAGTKLDDVASKVDGMDRRIERIESQRMLVLVALAGVGVGAILVSLVVWLLSVMVR